MFSNIKPSSPSLFELKQKAVAPITAKNKPMNKNFFFIISDFTLNDENKNLKKKKNQQIFHLTKSDKPSFSSM